MGTVIDGFVRQQLLNRRIKLEQAVMESDGAGHLYRLLQEVDSALGKVQDGCYGICEVCHEPLEADRLIADPLVRICLDHLSKRERSALEQDLELAARVQRGLLPPQNFLRGGWHISYHYEPAGLVSGDYCDVIDCGDAGLYFAVGDVSGKGVAASMLMAHLHAMFRALTSVGLSLKTMLEHASRVFSESTLPSQYATLVCGRALPNGKVEICNAGHPSPLIVRDGEAFCLDSTNLPVGMFSNEEFSVNDLQLEGGQSMIIYSDGVSEMTDASGLEYGTDRLQRLIQMKHTDSSGLIATYRKDFAEFRGDAEKRDDVTLFVLNRVAKSSQSGTSLA
ncbi:MAG: SpoIIE family protein phosphatase [Acidobacteriaceae bacterium]|nr:SpoIIE family protein phosphatase [Acidobacteriaceae bacterium]MBV9294251.1 SpoIIE family protein phosphatase [Acidobacteriaceae bacterium]MBV9763406.1 SpoIIE family protein phosphatase [Acidobacteriaceae bacterium]